MLVVGGALGFRRGFARSRCTSLLGVVGLPFFAEGKGGIDIIWGATGGLPDRVRRRRRGRRSARGTGLGSQARRIARGDAHRERDHLRDRLPWLKLSVGLSWAEAIADGLTPFILWDTAKLVVAGALFPAAWWLLDRRPDDR